MTDSSWFYSKDDTNNFNANNANNNAYTVMDRNNSILKNAKVAALLKYFSNFWQSLEM